MSIDLERGENTSRKGRPARVEVKKDERPTARKRVRGTAINDPLALPPEIREVYPEESYHLAFENDEKGRIQNRIARGWEVVKCEFLVGSTLPNGQTNTTGVYAIPVGIGETTSNMQAVLMAIPMEFWSEDLEDQKTHYQEVEASLRGGTAGQSASNVDTYAPRLGNGKTGHFSREVK